MADLGAQQIEGDQEAFAGDGPNIMQSDKGRVREFWATRDDENELDLRDILRILRRRKLVIFVTFILSILIAGITVFQLKPVYTADATVMIDTRKTQVVDVEAVLSGISTDQSAVLAEVEILKSRALAQKVIKKLRLINDPEFNDALVPPGFFVTLNENNKFIPESWMNFLSGTVIEDLSVEEKAQKNLRGAVINFQKNLSVAPIRRSPVIQIDFKSLSAKNAARIANTVAQEYLRDQLEAKYEATQRATQFLNDKLGELVTKLRVSEQAVDSYRRRKGLIEKKGSTLDSQQLSELNTKVIVAQADRAEAEARLKQVKSLVDKGSNFDTIAEVLSSPLIQNLREQETRVLRKASELSTEYGERHPKMINVRAEYRDLRLKIESEVRKIVKSLQNQVEVSRVREGSLRSSLRGIQRRVASQTRDEIKLRELERDAKANRAIYNTYLTRFNETSQQAGSQTADARIISKAEIPEIPSFPRKRLILLIVGIGSVFLGVVIVFLLERLDNGFRTPEQIEKITGIASLGMIPTVRGFRAKRKRLDHYVQEKPTSSISESVRSLKTSIMLSDVDRPPKVLCVTSSVPSEGKSTVSLWLSQVSAITGQKVLIIDCDLRRPNLHKSIGEENTKSLIEILAGRMPFEDVVYVDEVTGVHMVFGAHSSGNPLDILQSNKMKNLITAAEKHYDLIILDSPPALAVSDARVLAQLADKTIYLVKWDSTPREAVLAGLKSLKDTNTKFAGVLLSQVNVKKHAGYGYGDQGYYYGRYKEYYSD